MYTESDHRAAENRILSDMDRIDLVKGGQGRSSESVQRDAGATLLIVLVLIVCVLFFTLAGCGTIGGLGDDLRQWSDGIRGSVQDDAR